MHLDENLEVIAWQVGDLVHGEGQLHLKPPQGFISEGSSERLNGNQKSVFRVLKNPLKVRVQMCGSFS